MHVASKRFEILRNNVTYETRKSKQDLSNTYFEKYENDTYWIWKEIRQLLTSKYKIKRQPNIITVQGKGVTNPR